MLMHHFTFGIEGSDFLKLKDDLAKLFDLQLNERESGWWGIYATGQSNVFDEIKLYPNFVNGEGLHCPECSFKYLLDVSFLGESNDICGVVESSGKDFLLISHDVC